MVSARQRAVEQADEAVLQVNPAPILALILHPGRLHSVGTEDNTPKPFSL
jgi:hypothetical protein